jgi:hypothetical protein
MINSCLSVAAAAERCNDQVNDAAPSGQTDRLLAGAASRHLDAAPQELLEFADASLPVWPQPATM